VVFVVGETATHLRGKWARDGHDHVVVGIGIAVRVTYFDVVADAFDRLDPTSRADLDAAVLQVLREHLEHACVATGNVTEHLFLQSGTACRVQALDRRPDERRRDVRIVVTELRPQLRLPEPFEGAASRPLAQPRRRVDARQPFPVLDARRVDDRATDAKLVDEAQPGQAQELQRVAGRAQRAFAEVTGAGLDPPHVVVETEFAQHTTVARVGHERDVVVPIPHDRPVGRVELPCAREATEVRRRLEQRDTMAALRETQCRGHAEHAATDDAENARLAGGHGASSSSTVPSSIL
jgi:hypothetical protein